MINQFSCPNVTLFSGWSSCSDKSVSRHRRAFPGVSGVAGNTFLKIVSDTEEGTGEYEEQVISVWLDMDNESGEWSGEHKLFH